MTTDRYHHGGLRRAVLDAAIAVISESGPGAVSLRSLAKLSGVSHAAPAHHFGNKEGVFTALAAEGFTLFADALAAVGVSRPMAELGVAYVRFGLDHRAHFEIMFRPDLFDTDDPAVAQPRNRAYAALAEGAAGAQTYADAPAGATEIAAWALVHGLAALIAAGAVEAGSTEDVDRIVRQTAALMFPPA